MTKKKLAKLRRELDGLRAGKYSLKTSDLISFAKKVGRKRDTSRGKEPTYICESIDGVRPLSIPGHNTINPHTAGSILDSLEADLDRWEAWIEQQEQQHGQSKDDLPSKALRQDSDSD
jgi:hypothetical protein